ncbi:penicillin-binding protein, partial [Patescibacteria group bacterium]|nr:penicillin-binding protein [Patescibacteria group bacterium]
GQPIYSPRNYDSRFHGNVSLRTALACSYNVPAVKVLSSMGVSRMIEKGEDMGITTWEDKSRFGLSLTLGGGEVKMTDMAVVFASLANEGKRVDLHSILEVKDSKGKTLEKFNPSLQEPKVALKTSTAYILTNILSDNQARTPAFGPNSSLVIVDHPHVAVKTGTTQNMRDNWTIGYTPDFVVVVWVGNNDNSSMSYVASGVTGASPIWNKTMTFLLESVPDKMFEQPESVLRVEICPLTGTLSCTGCGGIWELFEKGTQPKYHCNPEEIKLIKNPTPTPST